MFDYLQQFNSLPKDLRDKVSSPAAMAVINELEIKYQSDLAMTVMKVMAKSLAVKNLPAYFISELSLSPALAENLTKELKEKLFAPVADYLGILSEMRALDLNQDIDLVIKEAGLSLPSVDLVNRFKSILSTYLKGIRNKIDARATFSKAVDHGGLSLSPEEVERIFKVCDSQKFQSVDVVLSSPSSPTAVAPASELDKIIAKADKAVPASGEYNLKQSIESGQVKKPAELDLAHELPVPEKILDLPRVEKVSLENVAPKTAPSLTPLAVPVPPRVVASPAAKSAPLKDNSPLAKTAAPVIPVTPAAKPSPSVRPVPGNRPVSAAAPNKPKVQDIRPMPKVMGPIEELQFLDLINFRRLGQTPTEATAKIFAKIKLLERDGYDKMIAGVKAWRQSPVSRLYVRQGQEAIAKGVTFKELIEARQKANQEYLKMEEVEALVSLNSKLVF